MSEFAVSFDGLPGQYVLRVDGPTSISIDANSDGKSMTINGVVYGVRVFLQDYGNGFELKHDTRMNTGVRTPSTWDAIYSSRQWVTGSHNRGVFQSMTPAARKRLVQKVIPAVNAWVSENPDLMSQGERDSLERNLRIAQAELQRAVVELAEAQNKVAAATERVNDLASELEGFTASVS